MIRVILVENDHFESANRRLVPSGIFSGIFCSVSFDISHITVYSMLENGKYLKSTSDSGSQSAPATFERSQVTFASIYFFSLIPEVFLFRVKNHF